MHYPPSPILTVGMPVYNGGKTLEAAIRSVLDQTERNLEVVISDNGSTDNTSEICQRMASEDSRIRYVRQPEPISPTDNFRFVLHEARAPYFMWAAHDDLRDPDFAEKLIAGLATDPKAILALGDIIQITNGQHLPHALDFVTTGVAPATRLRKAATQQLHHLYGIWKTPVLQKIHWKHVDWWHDTPLMMAASQLGDFIHVPGPRFIYLYNPRPFFGWRKKMVKPSVFEDIGAFSKLLRELVRMIWLAGTTVASVAGLWRGMQAAFFATWKILTQITGFLWRRRPGA
jgi:glycosyltransferase involved in cell wall biosynthesis